MKSFLFTMFFLTFLSACSRDKSTQSEDYIDLIPVKMEKPELNKPIMDEIAEQKCELEKLEIMHKYVVDDTIELD